MRSRPCTLATVSARALQSMEFPPQAFLLDGIVPTGLTLLAGRPKIGKSWLGLNLAAAVATGTLFLGRHVDNGAALYLALEDNERRLQQRLSVVFGRADYPERLTFATSCPPLNGDDEGAAGEIRAWCAANPDARLVVIDVLQRIRPAEGNAKRLYAEDYTLTLPLKKLADDLGIAVLVVTHTRKSGSEVDPIEQVSGTLGLVGAADTVLVLDRADGGYGLYGRGRDVEEFDLAVAFDPSRGLWTAQGDRAAVQRSEKRNAILEVLSNAPGPMGPAAIAKAAGEDETLVNQSLRRMLDKGEVVKLARGQYALPARAFLSDPPIITSIASLRADEKDSRTSGTSAGRQRAGSATAPDAAR